MTATTFREVPIEEAIAGLAARLADYPWCRGVHADLNSTSHDDIDPRNRRPIPVLIVLVRSRSDANRPEIPRAFPDVITGHPVLVRLATDKVGPGKVTNAAGIGVVTGTTGTTGVGATPAASPPGKPSWLGRGR